MTAPSEVITDEIHDIMSKVETIVGDERPNRRLVDMLSDSDSAMSDIRDMAEHLSEFADAWEAARDAGTEWVEADRSEKN